MSGKRSRNKGAAYEREIVNKLKTIFPDSARNLTETRDGHTGVDLTGTGNLLIQCKRYKQYAPITKIEEVMHIDGKIPVLITKGDRKPDMVVLSLDNFIAILEDVGVVYE